MRLKRYVAICATLTPLLMLGTGSAFSAPWVGNEFVSPDGAGTVYPWTRVAVYYDVYEGHQWSDIVQGNTFIRYSYDNFSSTTDQSIEDGGTGAANNWRVKGHIPSPGRSVADVDFTYAGEGLQGQDWRDSNYEMTYNTDTNSIQWSTNGAYHNAAVIVDGKSYAYVTLSGQMASKTSFEDDETAVIRVREYKDDTMGIVLRYRGNWSGTTMSDVAGADYDNDSSYNSAYTVSFKDIQISGNNWTDAIDNNSGTFDYNFKFYDGTDDDYLKSSGMQDGDSGGTDFSITVTDDDTTAPSHTSCNVHGENYGTADNAGGLAVTVAVTDADSGLLAGTNSAYVLKRNTSQIDSGTLTPSFSDGGAGNLTVTLAAGDVQTVGSYEFIATSYDADNDRTGDSLSKQTTFTFTVGDPSISHGPATLSFTMIRGKAPASQDFAVTNIGGGTLHYTNTVTYSGGASSWLSLTTPTTLVLDESESITVSIAESNIVAGTHYATNTITGDHTNGTKTVIVDIDVSDVGNPTSVTGARDGGNPASKIDLSWVRDAATTANVMVVRSTDASFVAPTNGDAYAQGNTMLGGDTVIYNGAATAFEDSGLISGTEYHYRLYSEYYKYYSSGVTTDITTSMPQAQNSGGGGTPQEPATLYVGDTGTFGCNSWALLEGNGAKWRVVIDTDNDLSDGAASAYGGSYVSSEPKTATSPAFTSATTWYWGMQVDYENFGDGHWYKADNSGWVDMATDGAGASLSVTVTALSGPGSLGAVTNTARPFDEIDLSWTKSNGHNVMIVRGADDTWIAPTNGDAYSEGSTVLGGDTVVYNGSGTTDTDTELAFDTTYYYRFYTVNNDYYSGGATVNEATEEAPPPEMSLGPGSLAFETGLGGTPSAQTFIVTNSGVATLLYTNAITYGAGPGWLTLAPTNSSLVEDAVQIHTASVSQATSVGSFTATNALTGSQDNGAQTVTVTYAVTNLPNPTALSASSIGTTNLTVNWTKSADYNVMVVRRAGANPDPPGGGTAYALNETYGTDNRNRIIYATDAGSAAADVGLAAGTVYHYGFFSENYSYYSSGVFLTTTTGVASVDGIADEWTGTLPAAVNSSTIVAGEFMWRDKENERREDSGSDDDVDLREFRIRADSSDVYFYIKLADITDVDYPYIAIAVDSDQSAADGAMTWIGDDADTGLGDGYYTNGNAGLHYPERNIIVHGVPGTGHRIELYADDGATWYAPSTGNDKVNVNGTDNFIEFAVARSDLNITGDATARFTVAAFFNNSGAGANNWGNNTDTTANYSGSDAQDSLTVLPYGSDDAAGSKNAWDEDLSDGDLDTFFDVTFDANGVVANTLPTTPSATFPAEGATIESGPMSVMWSESTDADDDVTSYFVEISAASDFGGGENLAVTRRGNARHLDPMYAVSSTLAADTYYWRSRARDLDGALSGHVTNSFVVSGTDEDTAGPEATLLYIGPTYTEGASQTNVTDKDFANTSDFVDIAVVWTDPSGVFTTNSAPYPNTNIVSAWGRVVPNWDLFRTNTDTHATQDFGYDQPFTTFYGANGATTVTTVYYNAFSITNALLDELFYLQVSGEDADDDRGDFPDVGHNGDPIPWDRAVTTNSSILIPITDDDGSGPVFSAVNVDGLDLFSTRMSGDLVITGLLQDAGSGVYAASNKYVLYRNNVQIGSGALSPAPGSDGAALASAEPIGVTVAEATATAPGAYRLDVTATDYDIERPGDSITVNTSFYFTVSKPDFDYRMRISTPSYTGTAPLTNFPVQVVLNTSRSGFAYSQFASPTGGDLRFCDEHGDTWLDYAFKKWDTGGSSTNWVKIPVLTTNSVIWAYWGNTTGTNAAPATTNGAVWSDWSEAQAGTSNLVFNGYASVVEPGTYFEFDADSAESGVSLPFTETFESVAVGSLDGENDWHARGTPRALNQTTKVYAGSRGAELEHATAWHGADDATGTNVWVNFFAWPEPCATNPVDPSTLSENTTALFYLNADGKPVVLSNSTWVTYSDADLGTNNWVRFIVNLDYVADEWGLWAITATTNARVATELPFENTTRSVFTSFRAVEGGLTPLSYFDNFGVGAEKPLGVDTDEDEMPDMWEETYMTNLNQTETGDLDSDGVSNLHEYLAGTNPNDSDDTMRVIDVDLEGASSANVRLKLLGGGAIGNTNFFPVGDEVERTFKIYAANNSATNTKTLVASVTSDASGTNTWTDNGMTDAYSSRYYEISVEHSSGGYTNTEEWAVHVQPRAASKSYMICAPVDYLGTNNNLNALLGDHLARGLHADTAQGASDRIEWIATDGSWARYWLGTTGWKVWGTTTAADVDIDPGQGMWVVRGSGGTTRNNAVFAGKSFTDANVEAFSFSKGDVGLSQNGWTIFGWPLPEPLQARASDTSQNQLGFFSGGGVGGESPDHTNSVAGDQIWIWNDGWSAYWLVDDHSGANAADGRWWKGHGTSGDDFADITLEPGKAYYYFHSDNWSATDFTWTPTNAP